jgi:SAM-dependent methyltransferase
MDDLVKLNIPFFYGVQSDKKNGGLPMELPFEYYFDKNLKIFRQKDNEKLNQLLQLIYLSGSMLNGEMNSNDGGNQGKAALEYIRKNIPNIKNLQVLEIGCGNGFILKELSKMGAKCVGLEPGPQMEQEILKKEGIELINDFFPTNRLESDFDLIIHFNVLEHLNNPIQALKLQASRLKPKGKIIFGVPNCEPNLKIGDLSIFTHEHYNYFTRDGVFLIAESCGLILDSVTIGASDGMIFCSMVNDDSNSQPAYLESGTNWTEFREKSELLLSNLDKRINKYYPEEIAIYCPKRALNALFLLKINNCRLIDDSIDLFGKYLPYFVKPIENLASLVDNPPKIIIIFSRTFSEEIMNKCRRINKLNNTPIFKLEEFDNCH